jgi:FMN phosphatase YigB (HAD superfamily)
MVTNPERILATPGGSMRYGAFPLPVVSTSAWLSGSASTLARMPALVCALDNVVFDVSFAGPLSRWRQANGGFLGAQEPRDLDDHALRSFEVGELSEGEYAHHLRAQLLWQGGDAELVEIFGDAFGPVDLDVLHLLGALRGEGWSLIGVLNTNPWHERVWRDLYRDALAVFDDVLTSTALGVRTPDHRFFSQALRGVPLEQMRLYVDHRPQAVSAARAAGLDAHLFRDAAGLSAACEALAAPAL